MLFRTTLTLDVAAEALPAEFRLFTKGWNATENGKYLFDDAAAKSVMSHAGKWGNDFAIDLEHGMIEVEAGAPDPTARDARGWCNLELRSDGSLWATNVRWTSDGAARLSEKRQRYISPAFEADTKTKRVLRLINVAITAIPATHKTPALVAANWKQENCMDPKMVMQALEAVEKGDSKAAMEILKAMIAAAAGAEMSEGDKDGSEGDGAEGLPEVETEEEAAEYPKVVDENAMPADQGEPHGHQDDEDEKEEDKPEKKAERKAMRVMLRHLTGTKSFAEALSKVEQFRASHVTLETERQKLAKERATLESAERRALVVDLVKMGAEFPATIWADDKAAAMKPRWQKMPIAELRSHVADQKAARKVTKKPAAIEPGAQVENVDGIELTVAQLAICKDMGCDPKDFAVLLRKRDGKKEGN